VNGRNRRELVADLAARVWRFGHVRCQRGQSSVAAILIEIADAAEREWLLCSDGTSGRGKVQMRPMR
jgi:hypothetical protein